MNQYRGTRNITAGALAALAVGGLGVGVVSFALAAAATSATAVAASAPVAPAGTQVAPVAGSVAPASSPVAPAGSQIAPASKQIPPAGEESGHGAKPNTSSVHLPTELSPNWAGPVLVGSVYDRVTTSFVVPQVTCSAPDQSNASFWAGLDGIGDVPGVSATVEQAGVRASCDGGTASDVAWTEDYPAGEDDIDAATFQVEPGDTITISVVANTTTDTYTLDNVTTGTTFTRSSAAPHGATDASAECVAEAPTDATTGKYTQLTDFGTVTFSQCVAQAVSPTSSECSLVSGQGCSTGSQRFFTSIATRDNNRTQIQAETKSSPGDGFSVTWHHS